MKKSTLSIALSALTLLLTSANCIAQSLQEADFMLTNVNIIPMNENRVLKNKTLVVKDEKIIDIIDEPESGKFRAAKVINGKGNFVIPGLADMHIHMRMDPQAMFNLFLANGVTTVSNARLGDGDGKVNHIKLKQSVAQNKMLGPRYLVSGPQLTPKNIPDLASVAKILEEHVREGYDVIKVHQDLPFDVYDALIKGAQKKGLRITGHTQHQMPLKQSLRMSSIEHAEEILYVSKDGFGEIAADFFEFMPLYYQHVEQLDNAEYRHAMIEQIKQSGIYLDPTLIIYKMISVWAGNESFKQHKKDPQLNYIPTNTREWYLGEESNPYRAEGFPLSEEHLNSNVAKLKNIVKELNQSGVPLLLGTDSFGTLVPGFSVHQELQLYVESGLTPYEALKTSTVNVAKYLEEYDRTGSIEKDKRADFVLLGANPLIDIKNTTKINGVFTHGNWLTSSQLQSMLEEAKHINNL